VIFAYRGTKFKLGQAGVTFAVMPDLNDAGDVVGHRHTWTISHLLTNQEQSETAARASIKAQQVALTNLYSINDGDLRLYNPDGATDSYHRLLNSDTRDGIRVTSGPSWPDGNGVELLTKRTCQVVLEGYVPVANSALPTLLRSFSETLQYSSAGAKYKHRETLRGRSVKYQSRVYQVYKVVQRGSAVGLWSYPPIPDPIWPFAVTDEIPEATYGSPKTVRGIQVDWPISWSWNFEHAFNLNGLPHLWKTSYFY